MEKLFTLDDLRAAFEAGYYAENDAQWYTDHDCGGAILPTAEGFYLRWNEYLEYLKNVKDV